MSDFLSLDEIDTLLTIKKACSIPSLLLSLFTVLIYWFFRDARGFYIENIICLIWTNIFYYISILLPFNSNWNDDHTTILCTIQSFFLNYFIQSKYIWGIIISFIHLSSAVKCDYWEKNKQFYRFIFLIPSIAIPFYLSVYIIYNSIQGNSACYCWISLDTTDRRIFWIHQEFLFWIIKMTELSIILFLVLKAKSILDALHSKNKTIYNDNEHLKYYPYTLLLSGFIAVINNCIGIFKYNQYSFCLVLIQLILDCTDGIIFFVIFITSPGIMHSIKIIYSNWIGRRHYERLMIKENGAEKEININYQRNKLYPNSITNRIKNRFSMNSLSSYGENEQEGEMQEIFENGQ